MSKCVFLANLLLILEVSGAKSIWRPLRELFFQMYNGNRVLVDFIEEERLAMTVSTYAKTFTMSTRISDFKSYSNGLCLFNVQCQFHYDVKTVSLLYDGMHSYIYPFNVTKVSHCKTVSLQRYKLVLKQYTQTIFSLYVLSWSSYSSTTLSICLASLNWLRPWYWSLEVNPIHFKILPIHCLILYALP